MGILAKESKRKEENKAKDKQIASKAIKNKS